MEQREHPLLLQKALQKALQEALQQKLKKLNPQQRQAVETTQGKVLVLAGAGSGKTSVLTHRIAYLILEQGKKPSSILGMTFTNKAAHEMRHRLSELLHPSQAKQVTLSTFHSFCMSILREEIVHLGFTKNFSLYTEREVKRILSHIARHLLSHEGELPSLAPTYAQISKAKSQGTSMDELYANPEIWHDHFVKEVFASLEISMRAYNAVDFDSLLTLTVELFQKHPQILHKYQEKYPFILIDEYQDTNPIQHKLAALLAEKHGNLCIVGDDDQSIYGWRGAEVRNILEFKADTLIKLEQNYRSTSHILDAANAVISCNQQRHRKSLWSDRPGEDLITLFHTENDVEEAKSVVSRLIWLHKNRKIPWKEMAILYRSNSLSRNFEMALMESVWEKESKWIRGIPFSVFGGTELAERTEIRDVIAFLRVISNPRDEEALLRIINVPRRGISGEALDVLTQKSRSQGESLWSVLLAIHDKNCDLPKLSQKALAGISSFVHLIQEAKASFESCPLEEAFHLFIQNVHYKKAIEEEVKSETMRAFKWENVLLLESSLERFEKRMQEEGKRASLSHFLSEAALDEEHIRSSRNSDEEDRVSLMTFHSAKGLEFTACFLVGIEDHIIPHEKSLQESGIEEERRLFYVALTRAKSLLTLSMAKIRPRMGKKEKSTPSRFLFEIPQRLVRVVSAQTITY